MNYFSEWYHSMQFRSVLEIIPSLNKLWLALIPSFDTAIFQEYLKINTILASGFEAYFFSAPMVYLDLIPTYQMFRAFLPQVLSSTSIIVKTILGANFFTAKLWWWII